MTWVGKLEWSSPEGHYWVQQLWTAWLGEGVLAAVWISQNEDGVSGIFMQPIEVDLAGPFTPGEVVQIDTLAGGSWVITGVERSSAGQLAISAYSGTTSG